MASRLQDLGWALIAAAVVGGWVALALGFWGLLAGGVVFVAALFQQRRDIRELRREISELRAERDELRAEREELRAERDELSRQLGAVPIQSGATVYVGGVHFHREATDEQNKP